MTFYLPDEFRVTYEIKNQGYLFSLNWELETNQLTIKHFSKSSPELQQFINPIEDQWRELWQVLEDVGTWQWYEEYLMTCNDSCQLNDEWEVHISWNDNQIDSSGENSYPPDFLQFIRALEDLTGVLVEFIHED